MDICGFQLCEALLLLTLFDVYRIDEVKIGFLWGESFRW
jgi:hypothetical protein